MPTKFKTFEALALSKAEELQQQIDDIFRKSIKDDFDSIPEGPFKSSLSGIDWIAIARPKNSVDTVNAVIFSKDGSGKLENHTWIIKRNGIVKPIQSISSELAKKYTKEEIALEIISLLERIGPSFIHITDLDILPSQDRKLIEEDREKGGDKEGDGGDSERPIDPERLKFFRSLKDAKFISANRFKGLKGYMVVFFDNKPFLIVENEYKGNAVFKVGLPESVDMKAIEEELLARKSQEGNREISKEELRVAVEDRYWRPISEKAKTRSELRALGAQRFVHTPGTWQETIRQAIESKIEP